jgi:hypothetical protein
LAHNRVDAVGIGAHQRGGSGNALTRDFRRVATMDALRCIASRAVRKTALRLPGGLRPFTCHNAWHSQQSSRELMPRKADLPVMCVGVLPGEDKAFPPERFIDPHIGFDGVWFKSRDLIMQLAILYTGQSDFILR